MTEDGLTRAKEYELQYLDAKEKLLILQKDYQVCFSQNSPSPCT